MNEPVNAPDHAYAVSDADTHVVQHAILIQELQQLHELQTITYDADLDDNKNCIEEELSDPIDLSSQSTQPNMTRLDMIRNLTNNEIAKLKSRVIKDMAMELNISIVTTDGSKKKTKKELVNEILDYKKNI